MAAIGRLIPHGSRVLVGYSGGADSTCLLHLLVEAGGDVVAGHLHHGQRAEADTELKLCEAFAVGLEVPFVAGRADVPRIAAEMGIGLEEAGREARYSFFRRAAHELGCDLIATAHTKSDLVETVLLNLCRGTGLAGLAGIPERRENIVRPLLDVSRDETRAYCEARGFWFHDDPANSDVRFARSRIRHHVVPELQRVNERAEEAIARLAGLVREEDRFLNGMAAAALERAEIRLNGDLAFLTQDVEMCFSTPALGELPPVLFRRAVRLAVEGLGGTLDAHQTGVIEAGVAGALNPHPSPLPLKGEGAGAGAGAVTAEGGEVVVEWTVERVHVRRLISTEAFRYVLAVPGETISDDFGWQFVAFPETYAGAEPVRAGLDVQVANVTGALYFRSVLPGDRMQPLGFDGRRKVSDLLGEAGLTSVARARLPIVCDMVGPIWVPGVCLDERARPRNENGRVVRMRFEGRGARAE